MLTPTDFPNPPLTNGQRFTGPRGATYEWDAQSGVWFAVGGGGGGGGGDGLTFPLTIPQGGTNSTTLSLPTGVQNFHSVLVSDGSRVIADNTWGRGPINDLTGVMYDGDIPRLQFFSGRGTPINPQPAQEYDILGAIRWFGYPFMHAPTDVDTDVCARLRAFAAENFAPDRHGTWLQVQTTPLGTIGIQTVAQFGPGADYDNPNLTLPAATTPTIGFIPQADTGSPGPPATNRTNLWHMYATTSWWGVIGESQIGDWTSFGFNPSGWFGIARRLAGSAEGQSQSGFGVDLFGRANPTNPYTSSSLGPDYEYPLMHLWAPNTPLIKFDPLGDAPGSNPPLRTDYWAVYGQTGWFGIEATPVGGPGGPDGDNVTAWMGFTPRGWFNFNCLLGRDVAFDCTGDSDLVRMTVPVNTDCHIRMRQMGAGGHNWLVGLQGYTSPGEFWFFSATENRTVAAFLPDGTTRNASGSWATFSDPRTKLDQQEYLRGLDVVRRLQPITSRYNGKANTPEDPPGTQRISLDAEAVQPVCPEMVKTQSARLEKDDAEDTEVLAIDNGVLPYLLLNAVKELAAKVEALEMRRGA